jgi:hypothetical protein
MKERDERVPRYVRRVKYLHAIGAIPRNGMAHIDVYHDGDCAHFEGRPCNCEPELKIRWTQPSAAQN